MLCGKLILLLSWCLLVFNVLVSNDIKDVWVWLISVSMWVVFDLKNVFEFIYFMLSNLY